MKTFVKTFFILTIFFQFIFASRNANAEESSFIFPMKDNKTLRIFIPKGYRSIQPIDYWHYLELVEFVPLKEDEWSWSSIISIHIPKNKNFSPSELLKKTLSKMSQITKVTVFSNKTYYEGENEISSFILRYDYLGKKEIMGAKYYSLKSGCGGVQYTIRMSENESERKVVKKINRFFERNIKITENN